jgi:hypothetical protein
MASRWFKLGSMIQLGMLNHSATHTEAQLVDEVETQLALAATGNEKANQIRRAHLLLMIHHQVGPVFPQLLSESRRIVAACGDKKMKLEHVLKDLCSNQAKTSGPPFVAFAKETKPKGIKRWLIGTAAKVPV